MTVYDWICRNVLFHSSDKCLIWPHHVSNSGYGKFTLKGETFYAHRYVCTLSSGAAPDGYDAAHECGNRLCVNPRHLSWKTRSANIADKITHGTHTFGEKHPVAKLTEQQAIQILKDPRTQAVIASEYEISRAAVGDIKTGKRWGHLQPQQYRR